MMGFKKKVLAFLFPDIDVAAVLVTEQDIQTALENNPLTKMTELALSFIDAQDAYNVDVEVGGLQTDFLAKLTYAYVKEDMVEFQLTLPLPIDEPDDPVEVLLGSMSLMLCNEQTHFYVTALNNLTLDKDNIEAKGIGTTLIQVAVQFKHHLMEQGFVFHKPLFLNSFYDVIPFYKKCGFEEEDPEAILGPFTMTLDSRFEAIYLEQDGYPALRAALDEKLRFRVASEDGKPPTKRRKTTAATDLIG